MGLQDLVDLMTPAPSQRESLPDMVRRIAQMLPLLQAPTPAVSTAASVASRRRSGVGEDLAGAYRRAGFQVLNEYTNPSPWSTGGHLHVQWPEQRDRQAIAARLRDIASGLGYNINVGGWGTGRPHRGLAHKQERALDISRIRRQ